MTKKKEKDSWDGYWENDSEKSLDFYDKIIFYWLEISKIFNKHINKYISKNKKYSFIELGCGGGNFLPYFQKKFRNFEIYGIDNSPEGRKIALERLKGKVSDSNIILGDILEDTFKNKKFDIAFSFGLIEHFDKPEIALKKHIDLLKKDGMILCFVPNLSGLQGKLLISKEWFRNEDKTHSNEYIFSMKNINPDLLKKWSKNLELKNVEILPSGGFLPMFILSTLRPEKKTKLRLAITIHNYLLMGFFILINIPFLFRINSFKFSPYIVITGKKQ
jgi:SAM-dependent methyltransferase